MPSLAARRRRLELDAAGRVLTADEFYELILAETEDEEKAQEASSEYAAELMRAGRSPGG